MTKDPLPSIVEDFAAEHPSVWDAYNQLGQAISEAGPLDEKARRLIKLAIAVGSGREAPCERTHVVASVLAFRAKSWNTWRCLGSPQAAVPVVHDDIGFPFGTVCGAIDEVLCLLDAASEE